MKLLTCKGYLIEEQGMTYLAEADRESALAPLQAAACTYRIALAAPGGTKSAEPANCPYRRAAAYRGVLCQRAGL